MLLIQKKQIDVFKAAALKKFEDGMVDHVRDFFPNHYLTIQENSIRKTIHYACVKAGDYGMTTVRNVCLYLDNMLILGSNFDIDPQYPWAKAILNDGSEADPKIRMDKLTDKTLETFDRISGKGHFHLNRVFINLRNDADDILRTFSRVSLKSLPAHLERLFPQKFRVIEAHNLKEMIWRGIHASERYGIRSEPCIAVYVAFMFLAGSGFDRDPQYSWAGDILRNPALTGQKEKVETLFYAAVRHLGTFLLKNKRQEQRYV